MKKPSQQKHLEKKASKKRGKGAAEAKSSVKRVDPNDLGDPRGSRAPRGDRPLHIDEKGDKRRNFKNK
jgi:hypothetical protein